MNMLNVHASALAYVNEAHHVFLLKYKKNAPVLYGFVEGKDDPMFYRYAVQGMIPAHWTIELIPSGGKDKVKNVLDAFDWSRCPENQICFFLDRDLDEICGISLPDRCNVYITDGYSIENSIVSEELFVSLLSEVFGVDTRTNIERERIIQLFRQSVKKFCRYMAPVMAQILGWKIDNVDAKLNKIDLPNMFHMKGIEICFRGADFNEREIIEKASISIGVSPIDEGRLSILLGVIESKSEISGLIRGKYLFWMFHAMLVDAHKNVCKVIPRYSSPPKIKLSIGVKNLMLVVAPRARTPDTLRKFIDETFCQHIRAVSGSHV